MTIDEIIAKIEDLPSHHKEVINAIKSINEREMPRVLPPEKPAIELRYPKDVSAMSSDALGRLYGEFKPWASYFKYLLTLTESDILVTKRKMNLLKTIITKDLRDRDPTIKKPEIDENVKCDYTMLQLEKFLMNCEATKLVVESRYDYFTKCADGLSREISRRYSNTTFRRE